MKDNVKRLAFLISAGFFLLAVYLAYIQVYQADKLYAHPKNQRLARWEETVNRGGIFDRNGEVLAETIASGGALRRVYPRGAAFAGVIGYNSPRFGKTGLEAAYNDYLLGLNSSDRLQNIIRCMEGKSPQGNNLKLTVDARLQKQAARLLGDRKGAAVVLNPSTGEILALVSSPSFDPGAVDTLWPQLNNSPDSPLLNRALQGLYPPGSTFKTVTGAAVLVNNKDYFHHRYFCPGYININGRRLNCIRVHGRVDFSEAMAFSCNVYFVQAALELGPQLFFRTAQNFGLNENLPFELPFSKSNFPTVAQLSPNAVAESAIGQGKVLVTPLQMALITASLANNGVMMRPFLVKEICNPDGKVLFTGVPAPLFTSVNRETAGLIKSAMFGVVDFGTGRVSAIRGVEVAGKTGSAQNPHGSAHAWFIGFAPVAQPRVAVVVVIENGGAGGTVAAPLARDLMAQVLGGEEVT
jgi:peptidoglycan glycosyltransferase